MTVVRALVRLVLVVTVAIVGLASPAAADPPAPTEWRSEVVSVDPEVDGFDVEVAGGDGFLVLTVEPGHEAIVYGYPEDGDLEQYLRFSADGTVERNLRSPATYINEDRYATIEAPAGLEPGDEPEWEVVATDGRYAWHDHRIHFMGTVVPEGQFDEPTPWEVPISVDGTDVVVAGTLELLGSSSPLPWVAVALVVAALLVVVAKAAPAALAVASIAAVAVSVATYVEIPPGAGSTGALVRVVVTGLAVLAAVYGLARKQPVAGLAAVALLAGWAFLRLDVLTNPVLPTSLPFALDKAVTAAALGAAVAGAIVVTRSGALRLPELTDDE